MTEIEEYDEYRAELQKLWLGFMARRLWCKWVKVTRPTYYQRDDLLATFGKLWPVECGVAALNLNLEIYGRQTGGEWSPLSKHIVERQQTVRELASVLKEGSGRPGVSTQGKRGSVLPDDLLLLVEAMRGVIERCSPPPGAGEAVHHLLEHKDLRRDHALLVLHELDAYKHVEKSDFKHLKAGGAARLKDGTKGCRFDGL